MNILKILLFFLASTSLIFFFGRLMQWVVFKANPGNYKKTITRKFIFYTNLMGIFSIVSFTVLYTFSLLNI